MNAGIGYTSLNCDFSVTYNRGFTAAVGLSRILMSDVVNAQFGYRITSRISSNLQSHYYRSAELDTDGMLETLFCGRRTAIRTNAKPRCICKRLLSGSDIA